MTTPAIGLVVLLVGWIVTGVRVCQMFHEGEYGAALTTVAACALVTAVVLLGVKWGQS